MNAPRAHTDVRSEINVTPLVDVCLVLLEAAGFRGVGLMTERRSSLD